MIVLNRPAASKPAEAAQARSRPRTKQAQIVRGAWKLFMDQGFGGTSMDAIAASADCSKATLYAYFKSKEDLFAYVLDREGRRGVGMLHLHGETRDIAALLHRTADDMARLILSPRNLAMYRIIMAEGRNYPDLGYCFFTIGPAALIELLARYLDSAMDRGELMVAPARLAAAHFIALILGDLQVRALLHVGRPPDARTRKQVAQQGVAAFLRAYAAPLHDACVRVPRQADQHD